MVIMSTDQRKAWLDARRAGLGGTDIARLFTPPKYRPRWLGTPLDVYADKILDPVDLSTDYQNRGRWLESAVVNWYAADVGRSVVTTHACWSDAYLVLHDPVMLRGAEPWMLASPDGAVQLPEETGFLDAEWGMDAKTSRSTKGWGEPLSDQVPMHIGLQMNWYMTVTGLPRWDVAVYFPMFDRFSRYTLMRDERICEALATKAGEWWHHHIVGRTPPDLTPTDSDAIDRLFPANSGKTVERANAADERLLEELRAARFQHRSAEHRKTAAEIAVKARLGDRFGLEGKAGRVTWGTTKSGSRRFVFETANNDQE